MDFPTTGVQPCLSVAPLDSKPLLGPPGNRAEAGEGRRVRQSRQCRHLALGLLPAGEWTIGAEANGRPLVIDGQGRAGPDLSLSHSGHWLAAAVCPRGRVGVDVETPRPGRDRAGLARAWLSAAEQARVAAEGEAALLAFWTMREAIGKLSGDGLALALAVDGAALAAARDGVCQGANGTLAWTVAHGRREGLHLALAWAAEHPAPWHGPALAALVERALAHRSGCAGEEGR